MGYVTPEFAKPGTDIEIKSTQPLPEGEGGETPIQEVELISVLISGTSI